MEKNKIKKYTFIIMGTFFLILGIIGIFLPILPTTPFLLLTSYFYLKSSKKLHDWLINHKVFGEYIYNYITYKGIRKKDKIKTLSLLYLTLSISFYFVDIIHVRIFLILVAIGVTIHILKLKTL
ncbi:MAG: YbaN family protein [Eubacteriales bacterium]